MPDMYDHLEGGFSDALRKMIDESGGRIWINSGYRSVERQTQLWQNELAKYGGNEAEARKWVAPPGHSNHNFGLAADLGGDLALAHQLAPQFGLTFPMSWEAWHIEPVYARQKRGDDYKNGLTTPPDGMAPDSGQDPYGSLHNQIYVMSELIKGTPAANLMGSFNTPTRDTTTDAGKLQFATGDPGALASDEGRSQWAADFLNKIGAPLTQDNIKFMVAWQRAESGGGGGQFNPLNTTQGGYPGESNLNSVGVKNYQSYADGIDANAKVINNGLYGGILDALRRGNDALGAAAALTSSPWGTGALVQKILQSDWGSLPGSAPTSMPGGDEGAASPVSQQPAIVEPSAFRPAGSRY